MTNHGTTYRGYDVEKIDGAYFWDDRSGERHGPFPTEDKALDDIDAFRKQMLAKG